MLKKIQQFCQKEHLLRQGSRIVVGVSGGADSICLLRVLCLLREELSLMIEAVHIHHGIRAEEADEDMRFVEMMCRTWNVPLQTFYEDVPGAARNWHMSLEEAGRTVRYEIFENVRKALGYDAIAVAHHMDDLAETVLMNIVRGSGICGVAGTRPVRGVIIRPLLCVRRWEIEQWLGKEGISWRTDSTNSEDVYFRNRIRHRMIPELENGGNKRAVEHIAGLASDLQEADWYFAREAKRLLEEARGQEDAEQSTRMKIYNQLTPPSVQISCELLRTQPRILASYLIRRVLEELNIGLRNISRNHIEQILELAERSGGKEIMLPDGIKVYLEYDRLVFEKQKAKAEETRFSVVFRIILADFTKKVPQNCCINWFDYDKIDRSIQLRQRLPGDRICVKAGGKSKKLKDYLIDARMPQRVRDSWPLLAAGSRILWIPGYRMDEDLKISRETKVVLETELIVR